MGARVNGPQIVGAKVLRDAALPGAVITTKDRFRWCFAEITTGDGQIAQWALCIGGGTVTGLSVAALGQRWHRGRGISTVGVTTGVVQAVWVLNTVSSRTAVLHPRSCTRSITTLTHGRALPIFTIRTLITRHVCFINIHGKKIVQLPNSKAYNASRGPEVSFLTPWRWLLQGLPVVPLRLCRLLTTLQHTSTKSLLVLDLQNGGVV